VRVVCEPTTKVRTYKESAGFHFEIGSFYFIRCARVRGGIVTVWGGRKHAAHFGDLQRHGAIEFHVNAQRSIRHRQDSSAAEWKSTTRTGRSNNDWVSVHMCERMFVCESVCGRSDCHLLSNIRDTLGRSDGAFSELRCHAQ
jgi:hypothetical protein